MSSLRQKLDDQSGMSMEPGTNFFWRLGLNRAAIEIDSVLTLSGQYYDNMPHIRFSFKRLQTYHKCLQKLFKYIFSEKNIHKIGNLNYG